MAAVEERDRHEVDQVEEEAGVGEGAQEVGVEGDGGGETAERGESAVDRPRERDSRVDPRVEAHVAQRDVGAEERDEDGELRVESGPFRLDVVAELVREDQEHDADRERPTPDQRVAADREEDPEELEDEGAELEQDPAEQDERRQELAEQRAARAVMLARQRVGLRRRDGFVVAVIAFGHDTVRVSTAATQTPRARRAPSSDRTRGIGDGSSQSTERTPAARGERRASVGGRAVSPSTPPTSAPSGLMP